MKNSPENLSTQEKNGRNPRRGNSKWDPPFLDVMGCNREQWVTTGAMSDLVPNTSYTIDPFTCPYMWPWGFNIISWRPGQSWNVLSTQPLLLFLKQTFLQFFHFVHDSCQSHNGLINSRPSWRQWAGFGLMQELWFGLGLCGPKCRKELVILTCIPFICVTHARPICVFWGESKPKLGPAVSLVVFVLLAASNYNGARNRESILLWQHDWFGTAPLSFFSISALRPFYLVVIKSYHSPALLCLIHLLLSFNLCHTALVYCWLNWLDLAINRMDWPKKLWSVSSICCDPVKYNLRQTGTCPQAWMGVEC